MLPSPKLDFTVIVSLRLNCAFFQRIVNGEPGRHGQAVQHPVVLLMEWEIKLGQELVQVGQMAADHATQ